eukprot:6201255-Pleurochrysis_carterae.AAC.3
MRKTALSGGAEKLSACANATVSAELKYKRMSQGILLEADVIARAQHATACAVRAHPEVKASVLIV